jgi:hypothetical protein
MCSLGNIVEEDEAHSHIPDYAIRFDGDQNLLFVNRGTLTKLNTSMSPLTAYSCPTKPSRMQGHRLLAGMCTILSNNGELG